MGCCSDRSSTFVDLGLCKTIGWSGGSNLSDRCNVRRSQARQRIALKELKERTFSTVLTRYAFARMLPAKLGSVASVVSTFCRIFISRPHVHSAINLIHPKSAYYGFSLSTSQSADFGCTCSSSIGLSWQSRSFLETRA